MKKGQKKLVLSRETLRHLRGDELPAMAGGNLTDPPCVPFQKDPSVLCHPDTGGPVPTGPFYYGCPSYGNQCSRDCP